MKTKVCRKCKKRKRINQFNKMKATKDGLCCWCRACYKNYNATRYQDNRVEFARKSLEKYYIKKAEQEQQDEK